MGSMKRKSAFQIFWLAFHMHFNSFIKFSSSLHSCCIQVEYVSFLIAIMRRGAVSGEKWYKWSVLVAILPRLTKLNNMNEHSSKIIWNARKKKRRQKFEKCASHIENLIFNISRSKLIKSRSKGTREGIIFHVSRRFKSIWLLNYKEQKV